MKSCHALAIAITRAEGVRFMKRISLADGAMGTMLQTMGLKPGESPDSWAIKNPEPILTVHRGYVEAGAEMLTACT